MPKHRHFRNYCLIAHFFFVAAAAELGAQGTFSVTPNPLRFEAQDSPFVNRNKDARNSAKPKRIFVTNLTENRLIINIASNDEVEIPVFVVDTSAHGIPLPARGTISFPIKFIPQEAQTYRETLLVAGGGETEKITLEGLGISPLFGDGQLKFPGTKVGDSTRIEYRVTNLAPFQLTVDEAQISSTQPRDQNFVFKFDNNSVQGRFTIAPKAEGRIGVRFLPKSSGLPNSSFRMLIFSNQAGRSFENPFPVQLITNAPKLRFPADSVRFQDLPCAMPSSPNVSLHNDGQGSLKLSRLEFINNFFLEPVIDPNDSVIASQEFKDYAFTFQPPSSGRFVDSLVVFSNAQSSPDTLPFIATVQDDQVPQFSFSPRDTILCAAANQDSAFLSFYVKVNDNCDSTLDVVCRATKEASVDTITIPIHAQKGDSFAFQQKFPAGVKTTVIVTATDDAGRKAMHTFGITVRQNRQLAFTSPSGSALKTLDFGRVECNDQDTASVIVKNTGQCPVAITQIDPPTAGGVFELLHPPAPGPLAPDSSVELKIVFRPVQLNLSYLDSIVILSDAMVPRFAVKLTGSAQDSRGPAITFQSDSLLVCDPQNASGDSVEFFVLVQDACSPVAAVACSAKAGNTKVKIRQTRKEEAKYYFKHFFVAGNTEVFCSAKDLPGNDSTRSFNLFLAHRSLSVSRTIVTFSEVECGSTKLDSIKLTNTGVCPLTVQNARLDLTAFFEVPMSVPFTIAPSKHVYLSILFRPPIATSVPGTLTLETDSPFDSAKTKQIILSGNSVDTKPPQITEAPACLLACAAANQESSKLSFNFTVDDCDPPEQLTILCTTASGDTIKRNHEGLFEHDFPLGSTMVTCSAKDKTGNAIDTSFQVSVVKLNVTHDLPDFTNLTTCRDSVLVHVFVQGLGNGVALQELGKINGIFVQVKNDSFFAKVPLSNGRNKILVSGKVQNTRNRQTLCAATCTDSIFIDHFGNIRNVVINEIYFDPAGANDLGRERIELKNVGENTQSLRDWALEVRRKESPDSISTTYWGFPADAKLAPGQRLEIHWLRKGTDDSGNLYTDLPADQDGGRFWGDNSELKEQITLGGATITQNEVIESRNGLPFSLALIQRFPFLQEEFENCRLVDFVQFIDSVGTISAAAVTEGIWEDPADAILPALSGFSYEFKFDLPNIASAMIPEKSHSRHFFKQAEPTLGRRNSLKEPPKTHVLISEICVTPDFTEFIEIFNPNFNNSTLLEDYYLTDHGDFTTADGLQKNGYIRIVKGAGALQVDKNDFLLRFPPNTWIHAREYLTIAFDSEDFEKRYNELPRFEVVSAHSTVPNMKIIKLGQGLPGLEDAGDMVLLFRWNGESNLVQDVDYVFWGATGFIDKSDIPIEGSIKQTYRNETPIAEQVPISRGLHPLLKSWQRRQNPREFGEAPAGGNSVTGQDETSEDLSQAFSVEVPSPDSLSGALDLGIIAVDDSRRPNGEPNRVVNPGEEILLNLQLINFGVTRTGELVARLFTNDTVVTIIDGNATYPSLAPRDSTPVNTAFSRQAFRFSVPPQPLPDSLYFTLEVLSKPTALENEKDWEAVEAAAEIFEIIPVAINTTNSYLKMIDIRRKLIVQSNDTTLHLTYRLKNTLKKLKNVEEDKLTARDITVKISRIDSLSIEHGAPATGHSYTSLSPQDVTNNDGVFSFNTIKRFQGDESPDIIFHFTWEDDFPEERQDTLKWEAKKKFSVQGRVTTFGNNLPVRNARVSLTQGNRYLRVAPTDEQGDFKFSLDDSTYSAAYSLTVARSGIPANAITGADTLKAGEFIERVSINSSAPTVEGFQMIAADVDGSGRVSGNDLREIRSKLRQPCKRFPIGKEWLFIDRAAPNVSLANKPEQTNFILKNYDFENMNFAGILLGDVDGSVEPQGGLENTGDCLKFDISGTVSYFRLNPPRVPGVIMQLSGGMFDTTRTDSEGNYAFRGLLAGLNYRVKLFKHEAVEPRNSGIISVRGDKPVFDLIAEGNPPNPNSFVGKAADVDLSGNVGLDDYDDFVNYLGRMPQNNGGQTGAWAFFPPSREYPHLNDDSLQQNYNAVILGNVDTQWPLPAPPQNDSIGTDNRQAVLSVLRVAPGEVFTLELPQRVTEQWPQKARIRYNEKHVQPKIAAESLELQKQLSSDDLQTGLLYLQIPEAINASGHDESRMLNFKAIGTPGDSSLIEIESLSPAGSVLASEAVRVVIVHKIPDHFFLAQNYPNPFNPATTIAYGLPQAVQVELMIFNVMGQVVFKPVNEVQEPGYYKIPWFGRDAHHQPLPSGVYFSRLRAGDFLQIRKMTLLK